MLIKKLTTTLMSISVALGAFAANERDAQISTVPSPAISNKPLEVKITTGDLGSEVYCYTWCTKVNDQEKKPTWDWNGVHTDKFKMTGSNGTYTFSISNIKEFYGLTDDELAGLTELGFIAKNSGGDQTKDLLVTVEQGRRDAYAGGDGTLADPFVLTTSAHLAEFASTPQDWGADVYVKLGSDINGRNMTSPIGTASNPYQGHFDGNGHTVSDVTLTSTTLGQPVGFFGAIRGAEIKNFGLVDVTINGKNNVGALVGTAESGQINRCFAIGGSVTGYSICVGGLVGENIGASITDCYTGLPVGNGTDYATGGVVGKNRGEVKNVYATGLIAGYDYVGGIVGANYGKVSNSVALNYGVSGAWDYFARFGGNGNSENHSTANHSWESIRNLTGYPNHGDHATMKTATELSDFNTFKSLTSWDFDNTWEWKSEAGKSFPVLRGISNQKNTVPEDFYLQSGVEEIIEANGVNITAGPNPVVDALLITCSENIAQAAVYSVSGVCVVSAVNPGLSEITFDMSATDAGIYIVNVVSQSGAKSTFKLIKK